MVKVALARLTPAADGAARDREALASALSQVEAEVENLTRAIEQGGQLSSLLAKLRTREQEMERLQRELATADHARKRGQVSPSHLHDQLMERFAGWREVLTRKTPIACTMLKKLLDGPIRFSPMENFYEFEGLGTLAKVVADDLPNTVASPTRQDTHGRGPWSSRGGLAMGSRS